MPSDQIDLNVRGEIIKTSLTTLKKIKGSRLEKTFSGAFNYGYDSKGRPFIDSDA